MGAWASVDDVSDITGESVSAANLAAAHSDIEVYCNRSPEASAGMGARDLRCLKLATSYQAAWRSQQTAVSGRQAVASYSQAGMSVNYGAEWQVTLAPMAGRALKNLSWKADRTARVPNVRLARGLGESEAWGAAEAVGSFVDETSDTSSDWHPL